MPRPHPPEFRRRAVEMAREHAKPVTAIAKDLGISNSCLRNWMAQDDFVSRRRVHANLDERAELHELRRKLQVVEKENATLRRTVAYLTQENDPPE